MNLLDTAKNTDNKSNFYYKFLFIYKFHIETNQIILIMIGKHFKNKHQSSLLDTRKRL